MQLDRGLVAHFRIPIRKFLRASLERECSLIFLHKIMANTLEMFKMKVSRTTEALGFLGLHSRTVRKWVRKVITTVHPFPANTHSARVHADLRLLWLG